MNPTNKGGRLARSLLLGPSFTRQSVCATTACVAVTSTGRRFQSHGQHQQQQQHADVFSNHRPAPQQQQQQTFPICHPSSFLSPPHPSSSSSSFLSSPSPSPSSSAIPCNTHRFVMRALDAILTSPSTVVFRESSSANMPGGETVVGVSVESQLLLKIGGYAGEIDENATLSSPSSSESQKNGGTPIYHSLCVVAIKLSEPSIAFSTGKAGDGWGKVSEILIDLAVKARAQKPPPPPNPSTADASSLSSSSYSSSLAPPPPPDVTEGLWHFAKMYPQRYAIERLKDARVPPAWWKRRITVGMEGGSAGGAADVGLHHQEENANSAATTTPMAGNDALLAGEEKRSQGQDLELDPSWVMYLKTHTVIRDFMFVHRGDGSVVGGGGAWNTKTRGFEAANRFRSMLYTYLKYRPRLNSVTGDMFPVERIPTIKVLSSADDEAFFTGLVTRLGLTKQLQELTVLTEAIRRIEDYARKYKTKTSTSTAATTPSLVSMQDYAASVPMTPSDFQIDGRYSQILSDLDHLLSLDESMIHLYAVPKGWRTMAMRGFDAYAASLKAHHDKSSSFSVAFASTENSTQSTVDERGRGGEEWSLRQLPLPPQNSIPILEGMNVVKALKDVSINPSAFYYFASVNEQYMYLHLQKKKKEDHHSASRHAANPSFSRHERAVGGGSDLSTTPVGGVIEGRVRYHGLAEQYSTIESLSLPSITKDTLPNTSLSPPPPSTNNGQSSTTTTTTTTSCGDSFSSTIVLGGRGRRKTPQQAPSTHHHHSESNGLTATKEATSNAAAKDTNRINLAERARLTMEEFRFGTDGVVVVGDAAAGGGPPPVVDLSEVYRIARYLPCDSDPCTPQGALINAKRQSFKTFGELLAEVTTATLSSSSAPPLTQQSLIHVLLSHPSHFEFQKHYGLGGANAQAAVAGMTAPTSAVVEPPQFTFYAGVRYTLDPSYVPKDLQPATGATLESVQLRVQHLSQHLNVAQTNTSEAQRTYENLIRGITRGNIVAYCMANNDGRPSPLLDYDVAAQAIYDALADFENRERRAVEEGESRGGGGESVLSAPAAAATENGNGVPLEYESLLKAGVPRDVLHTTYALTPSFYGRFGSKFILAREGSQLFIKCNTAAAATTAHSNRHKKGAQSHVALRGKWSLSCP